LDCSSDGGGVSPLPMDLGAYMTANGPASFWIASDHTQGQTTGPFSWTALFHNTPPTATWSFLMDGIGDVTLVGADPGTWCNVLASPSTVITEAVFIIDAEFPVAVEPSTWGKVKALYR
jgi:hypothetical protein